MNISKLAEAYFHILDQKLGPFDRPMQFRPFPFDAGGAVNLLTASGGKPGFVTYVTWDLFGHPEQKRGRFGRYELSVTCDDERWCQEILTQLGRQGLSELVQPEDTVDIGPWVGKHAFLQGLFLEDALSVNRDSGWQHEPCGVMRCVGLSRAELNFAITNGVELIRQRLKAAGIYPRTTSQRASTT